ncbi:MAG: uncharacterized protein KVP18_004996 [Porospora cf. gigantea A]|uniref:uncharacterized protein n=1 Tax=Porospora cf. gigantea A TaxID=2853593 RepID=UPI003559C6CD|nr:MAG: hypothetical protein KVP18_004996 [Porospora cf. gigantea A]
MVADTVTAAVLRQWADLTPAGKPQGDQWTVLAGFCLESDAGVKVLSLATGVRASGHEDVLPHWEDGRLVHGGHLVVVDCHAEILARRALNRLVLLEILALLRQPQSSTVLVALEDGRLVFRPAGKLHLYVSYPPCGDAHICAVSGAERSLGPSKRARLQHVTARVNLTGAKPLIPGSDSREVGGDFHAVEVLRSKSVRSDVPARRRPVSVSCSDKLMRWLHLGLQTKAAGGLVSGALKLHSLVIGGDVFDVTRLHRTFIERCRERTQLETSGVIHHTSLAFEHARESVTAETRKRKLNPPTSGVSVVWLASPAGGTKEVLAGGYLAGCSKVKLNGYRFVSALSKKAMASLLFLCLKECGQLDDPNMTYKDAKNRGRTKRHEAFEAGFPEWTPKSALNHHWAAMEVEVDAFVPEPTEEAAVLSRKSR